MNRGHRESQTRVSLIWNILKDSKLNRHRAGQALFLTSHRDKGGITTQAAQKDTWLQLSRSSYLSSRLI